jgi:hypothetical protein
MLPPLLASRHSSRFSNLIYDRNPQSSDIIGDRRYAARKDATEWELDRYGQSLLHLLVFSFLGDTALHCGAMNCTIRVSKAEL